MSAAYAIDPIRDERNDDPATTKLVEDTWRAVHGEPLASIPPAIGWQVVLLRDGAHVEQHQFGAEGFADAQDAGSAWLRQHGGDSLDAFTARAMQAWQRMHWDHDYRHAISRRGF